MQTSVTFKNLESSDHLRDYVADKLNRFDKYLDTVAEANVVLSVEKFRHIAEINIVGDKLRIKGKEETNDMYSAIDMVLDKLEKQIKKNKEKIRNHKGGGKNHFNRIADVQLEPLPEIEPEAEPEDSERQVVIQNIEYKPMDVEEAVMQMDLGDDNFLVFTNSKTDHINVLYRRNDGNLGLIQPSK